MRMTNIELQQEVEELKAEIKLYKKEVEALKFSITGIQSLVARYVENETNKKL
jgi:prefoldin subunit 5